MEMMRPLIQENQGKVPGYTHKATKPVDPGPPPIPQTQRTFDHKIQSMRDPNAQEIVYVTLPKPNLKNIVAALRYTQLLNGSSGEAATRVCTVRPEAEVIGWRWRPGSPARPARARARARRPRGEFRSPDGQHRIALGEAWPKSPFALPRKIPPPPALRCAGGGGFLWRAAHRPRGDAQRAKKAAWTIVHLPGSKLARPLRQFLDMLFDPRVDVGKSADGAGDRARRDLRPRR